MMRRFVVFAHKIGEAPKGGWNDVVDSWDTALGAEVNFVMQPEFEDYCQETAHIVDLETGERIDL